MGKVTESIFSDKHIVIPMADVQHIEKEYHSYDLMDGTKKGDFMGATVITKHTRWDMDCDAWANPIWLSGDLGKRFIRAWCQYRSELESETILQPE